LIALGVGNLKSMIGCGNPVVELVLDNEIWSSELKDNALYTQKAPNEQKDLIIKMSKQEAVKAILSENIKEFMKSSVSNGNTGLEMISGKACLLAKGYLEMYEKLK
jgi:hypothetical protein